MRWNALLAAVLLLSTVGCGGLESDQGDEEFASAESALTHSVHHYSPGVQDVRWDAGCGTPPPGGYGCQSGVVVTFTKSYADLKSKITTSLNRSTKTLTITIDTYSSNTIHSMIATRPEDHNLGTLNLSFGTKYKVKVVDHWKHVLWEGDITPAYAA